VSRWGPITCGACYTRISEMALLGPPNTSQPLPTSVSDSKRTELRTGSHKKMPMDHGRIEYIGGYTILAIVQIPSQLCNCRPFASLNFTLKLPFYKK
jgi:hypothetical protein